MTVRNCATTMGGTAVSAVNICDLYTADTAVPPIKRTMGGTAVSAVNICDLYTADTAVPPTKRCVTEHVQTADPANGKHPDSACYERLGGLDYVKDNVIQGSRVMIFGEEDDQHMGSQPQKPQQIRLNTDDMETVYANFFALAGSADEIVLYLGANSPLPTTPQPAIKISHRLMMLPPNAKRLMLALRQAVEAHEDRFGPIELPPPRRPDRPL